MVGVSGECWPTWKIPDVPLKTFFKMGPFVSQNFTTSYTYFIRNPRNRPYTLNFPGPNFAASTRLSSMLMVVVCHDH